MRYYASASPECAIWLALRHGLPLPSWAWRPWPRAGICGRARPAWTSCAGRPRTGIAALPMSATLAKRWRKSALGLKRGVLGWGGTKCKAPPPRIGPLRPDMLEALFAIPGDLDLQTGGYTYDR